MLDLHAQLSKAQLYLVLGAASQHGRSPLEIAEKAIQGGVDILQLRDKELPDSKFLELARGMRDLAHKYKVLFFINDRPDIARLCEADGVHLGQEDLRVEEAREILKEGKLVGVSTHSLEQAKKAVAEGPGLRHADQGGTSGGHGGICEAGGGPPSFDALLRHRRDRPLHPPRGAGGGGLARGHGPRHRRGQEPRGSGGPVQEDPGTVPAFGGRRGQKALNKIRR